MAQEIVCVTRSGRVVKKPIRYEPQEEVCDDYDDESGSDFDSDSDIESIQSGSDDESEIATDDDDAGSLADFVNDDDEEEEEEDDEEEELSEAIKKMECD